MRHADKIISSIGNLIDALNETANQGITWYRGQSDADWSLIPGIARPPAQLNAELTTIKRFKQNANPYLFDRPRDDWEWISLMQHHRAPTRLLDWSESPIAALYFATESTNRENRDAALWCIDPIAINHAAGHRRAVATDILALGIDSELDAYLPERVNARVADLGPVAVIGQRNSPRIVAQSGTFTVIHAAATPIETVNNGACTWRFLIPADQKAKIRRELKLLGISELSMFPDLDRVAAIARDLAHV